MEVIVFPEKVSLSSAPKREKFREGYSPKPKNAVKPKPPPPPPPKRYSPPPEYKRVG